MRPANTSWFGEMKWVFWNECMASIPLLAHVSAQSAAPWLCQDSTATAMEQHCTSLDVTLERDTWTTQCHCYELWEQFRMQKGFQSLSPTCVAGETQAREDSIHNKPSTYGKNGGCRDPELPQPSWEFPFKRWHHQKLMHEESTHSCEYKVQKVNGPALFFPFPKCIEGKTVSSHKAKETTFLKIEVSFRRDTSPHALGMCQ